MANIIFYFTGTGNSLVIARDIARNLGDTKVVSIAEAIREPNIELAYERIGFVFPVYFGLAPGIVERFIGKLQFEKNQYIFGVINYGGTKGMALYQLSRRIAAQGGFLHSGFSVTMPGNYIVKYGAFPAFYQKYLLRREKKKAVKIADIARVKKAIRFRKGNLLWGMFAGYMRQITDGFGKMAQNFHINNRCNGCGICKKVCPVNNIRLENQQPSWGRICEQCMACIQWCPSEAVEYADKTAKRRRFRNPEVTVKDLILDPAGSGLE